ncbi:hypothetical protein GCM10029964_060970 [Kibdelosporangium lantanae]
MRIWLLTLTAVAMLSGLVLVILATSTTATLALRTTPGTCAPTAQASDTTTVAGLTGEQVGNAVVIIQVGQQLGISSYGQQIAIATAMQESRLRNLDHGDRDSLGLFQQRPSQGWGARDQILNPQYAATAFYTHLQAIPDWQHLPLWEAAQAVQHSAFPEAYQQWAQLAAELVQQHGGDNTCTIPGGPQVEQAIAFAMAQLGKPYVWGATGPDAYDCSGLMLRSWQAAGITLNRTSTEQYHNGNPVPLSQAARGDLLFWSYDHSPAGIHHVAMYLGNNTIIEANKKASPSTPDPSPSPHPNPNSSPPPSASTHPSRPNHEPTPHPKPRNESHLNLELDPPRLGRPSPRRPHLQHVPIGRSLRAGVLRAQRHVPMAGGQSSSRSQPHHDP